MADGGGWLARVARRLAEIVAGQEGTPADDQSVVEEGTRADAAPSPATPATAAATTPAEDVQPPTAINAKPPIGDRSEAILPDANGRYVVGCYSFSSAAQAAEYRARSERRTTDQQSAAYAPSRAAPPSPPSPPSTSAPPRSSPSGWPRPVDSTPRWIRDRTDLVAGRHSFQAEMVYYGSTLRYEGRHDHSRIDPAQPVDSRAGAPDALLDYWPSYLGLKPQSRRRYLDWLSDGRTDSTIPIGYVFLFFYGLEQRLLVDDARDESERIFAEVRRLLALHGSHSSFHSYASRLLALSVFYEDSAELPLTAECAVNYDLELPLDLRVRLGLKLRDGKAFDADDALRWVLALPDVYLRTPGQRCFDELRALWSVRFAARYPAGLSVRRPRSLVKQEYRAASGKFTTTISVDALPDISGTTAPLAPLRAMLDGCMEELSAYSRLLGRNPEARGRPRGDLLLPAELRAGRASIGECRSKLAGMCGVVVEIAPTALELARLLDVEVDATSEKLPAAAARQIGLALDALDHGYEPDRRYGPAAALRRDTKVIVFPAAGGAPVEAERPAYLEARGLVEVATLAAAADGEVVTAEIDAIERRLRGSHELREAEIARLLAHARALAADPPKVRAALKRLAEVAPGRRAALAASAVEAVLADGRVEPAEVKFLEALHATLGLPAASLYSALHRGGLDEPDVGPVTVVETIGERSIPLPREALAGGSVPIDLARLERIRGETTKVSELLSAIFVEEEPETAGAITAPKCQPPSAFEGLDGAHSELLTRLLAGTLHRAEFEDATAELRLMPDGAIEALNEWGFDRFGEPIIDDDDGVSVTEDARKQLVPMGVAA